MISSKDARSKLPNVQEKMCDAFDSLNHDFYKHKATIKSLIKRIDFLVDTSNSKALELEIEKELR